MDGGGTSQQWDQRQWDQQQWTNGDPGHERLAVGYGPPVTNG